MRLFQQPTEILHYSDVPSFLNDFSFHKDDYILASKTIYEHFFKDKNLPCTVALPQRLWERGTHRQNVRCYVSRYA